MFSYKYMVYEYTCTLTIFVLYTAPLASKGGKQSRPLRDIWNCWEARQHKYGEKSRIISSLMGRSISRREPLIASVGIPVLYEYTPYWIAATNPPITLAEAVSELTRAISDGRFKINGISDGDPFVWTRLRSISAHFHNTYFYWICERSVWNVQKGDDMYVDSDTFFELPRRVPYDWFLGYSGGALRYKLMNDNS